MDRARGVPAADEDKQSDEQVQQGGDAQIIFDGRGVFLRCGDQRSFEGAAVAAQFVADFSPGADVEQDAGDVRGAMNGHAADGCDDIALFDAGFGAGRIGDNVPGGDALGRVHPGDAVIGQNEARTLLKVEDGENDGRQCEERQNYRSEPHSQAIVHASTPISFGQDMLARQVPANHRFQFA